MPRDKILPTHDYIKGYDLFNTAPAHAFEALTAKEYLVLSRRFGDLKTLQAVGDELGITRERVRQIQERAVRRLLESL